MTLGSYIIGIIGASVTVSIIELLLPDDKNGSSKAVGFVCSLALLCVIIAPLGGMLAQAGESLQNGDYGITMPDGGDYGTGDLSGLYTALGEASRAEIEAALEAKLAEKFDVPETNITVYAAVTVAAGGEVSLTGVTVCLGGRAMWLNPHEIKDYVYQICGVTCEVVTGQGE